MKRQSQSYLAVALFFISSAVVLSLCLYTGNTLYSISRYAYTDTEERLLSLCRYASQTVTAAELDELQAVDDMEKPIFGELRERLYNFAVDNNILYIYYMRNDENGMAQYIIDNDYTDGTVNLSTEPFEWENKAALAMRNRSAEAEMEIYLEGYEHLISAFAPVFDSEGRIAAVAGVDIDDKQILAVRNTMNILVPLLVMGILITTFCGFVNLMLHKRTDKALKTALNNALTASRAKSDFLANMSHEIRTPMNAIIGMVSIAETSYGTDKKDYAIGKIKEASKHLLGIINDILDMSKIEANKFDLSPITFNFEEMLQKVVNINNIKAAEKHQDFTVYIDSRIPEMLICDDQRLTQVISNLLSNAIKFTPEQGAISMRVILAKEENNHCMIQTEVEDKGPGISKEQMARLFNSFEQAENSTTRKYGGTGLGLAISKRIVEKMGGEVWVSSELGKGSVFAFTIRADKPAATGTATAKPIASPGAELHKINVLLVDDDEDILTYCGDILLRFGVSCDMTTNAADAIELIKAGNKYDVCFIDWKMPGMNGIELTRRIRDINIGDTVIIMITSVEWSEIEEEAKEAGVDGYLPKPVFPSALFNCLYRKIGDITLSEAKQADDGSEPINFDGYRVLLVEDIEINREIVLALLEPTKLAIDCVENGREALLVLNENLNAYDMIFMDIQMPEMDGYETTRAIRAIDSRKAKSIPIIAMTANVFLEDIDRCKEAGMNDHIGKPIDYKDMLTKLKKYLANRRQGGDRRKTDRRCQNDRRQGVDRRSGVDRRAVGDRRLMDDRRSVDERRAVDDRRSVDDSRLSTNTSARDAAPSSGSDSTRESAC